MMISQFYKIVIFIPFSIYLHSIDFFLLRHDFSDFCASKIPFRFLRNTLNESFFLFRIREIAFCANAFLTGKLVNLRQLINAIIRLILRYTTR